MAKQTLLSKLALCAAFFSLSVIALGAFTRLIDAGLGCPDWPGCYGHLIAPDVGTPLAIYKAWAEMIHRYFVGCLSLLILGIVAVTCKKEFRSRGNIILAACLVLLLVYQICLGRWTVTLKLLPIVVTQHLLGGFLILSVLWLIYLNNSSSLRPRVQRRGGNPGELAMTVIGLVILFAQITLGAWTSTNYASLSCPGFPFCMNDSSIVLQFKNAFNIFSPMGVNYQGGVLPEAARQTIQMTHRIGALVFSVYFFVFFAFAFKKWKRSPDVMKSFYLIFGLLFVQLCIGMSNVIFKLPLITAISHNLVAVLLLLSMITLLFKFTRAS